MEEAASRLTDARVKDAQTGGDVRLIARAAAILRALTEQPRGASLGELAKATGIPRSTVQRLVAALEAERMVTTNAQRPGVRLGVELCRMAASSRKTRAKSFAPTPSYCSNVFMNWSISPIGIETSPS